jgi:hypothetical protein
MLILKLIDEPGADTENTVECEDDDGENVESEDVEEVPKKYEIKYILCSGGSRIWY